MKVVSMPIFEYGQAMLATVKRVAIATPHLIERLVMKTRANSAAAAIAATNGL